MFCTKCGNRSDLGNRFCSNCGTEMPVTQVTPEPQPVAPPRPPREPKQLSKKAKKALIVAAVSIVSVIAVIGATLFAINEYQITAKDNPTLAQVLDEKQIKEISDGLCDTIEGSLFSQEDTKTYQARIASMQSAINNSNERYVIKFWNKIDYQFTRLNLTKLEDAIATSFTSALKANTRIVPKDLGAIEFNLKSVFRAQVLKNCALAEPVSKASSLVVSYNSTLDNLSDAYENAPWYPNGYYSWAMDDNLAWKWISGAGNDCYSCWYWTIEVISRYGCPGGVYAEFTELNGSGTVVDWTNDSIPSLNAGDKARLQFETWNSSTETGRLSELNCNSY